MKKSGKRIARQRMVLGVLLLVCVLMFTWTRAYFVSDTLPLFGYENGYYDNGLYQDIFNPDTFNQIDEGLTPRFFDSHLVRDAESLLVGLRDVIFLPPANASPQAFTRISLAPEYMEQLMDFTYIRNHIFLEDPSTLLLSCDIDAYEFFNADLRIDPAAPGPHVLIFHTHSTEWFADTDFDDPMTGIMGAGRELAWVLSELYGLEVLHYTSRFDVIDGSPQVMGAYERMEPVITALLAENPTIQLVIDLHRDGVRTGVGAFTRNIDGVPTARLMFFNGLSRRNANGQPVATAWLPNPYQTENLQLSFQAQLAANQLFPDLNRRIYLRAYRFSLHMHPRTLFVEVGNQYNTLQEAKNAMYPLARIIADVVLGER